ncbi:MAG: DUF1501 domain-containing protein [Planctomycetia bacterium]
MGDLHQRLRAARAKAATRRAFLHNGGFSLGAAALAGLTGSTRLQAATADGLLPPGAVNAAAAKAKHVIYLSMSGGPPQQELFDWKPKLVEHHLQPCPEELLKNQRFAFIKGRPLMLGTPYKFAQHGQSGAWISELLPNLSKMADDLAIIRTMTTDQFNHAPAELLLHTGSPRPGGAAIGSWATYGLGTESQELPGFVVLVSGGTDPTGGKSLWGSGFLPSVHQGVQCRTTGDPILYVTDPAGVSRDDRRRSLDALNELNALELGQYGDPETRTRIEQYELAFRMQAAVPDAMDLRREPEEIRKLYGAEPGASSFANNCLLARRLIERGVRYVQLFDWGWDCHGTGAGDDIVNHLPTKTKQVDQASAALLADLKQRGLLDETLVIWGGEFGRTAMNEARGGSKFLGRDHHPACYSIWMAGAGVKKGVAYGETDELGYSIAKDPVRVQDLQATVLHLLGIDPWKMSYPHQGLKERLIGPAGEALVLKGLLS